MSLKFRRYTSCLLALGACLALAGCATKAPPTQAEIQAEVLPETTVIPGKWASAAEAGEVPDGWLKTYNDPQMEAVVGEALKNNLGLRAASANLDAAAAAATIAGARLKPTVGLGGGGSSQTVAQGGGPSQSYGADVNVSWELDVWGKLRTLSEASEQEFQAAQADLESAPFQAAVDSLSARLALAELRQKQASELAADQAGSVYEVQQYDAEVRGLQADLKAARWNLDQTTVKAPADGWVPYVALLPGVRLAAGQAAMTFIDESETFVVVQMQQINTRHIEPGDAAEVIFKLFPGQVFSATVVRVLKANSSGQLAASGTIVTVDQFDAAPFLVHLSLDDQNVFVPAGSVGTAAIYTDQFTGLSHVIRKILLHQQNWKNYIQI